MTCLSNQHEMSSEDLVVLDIHDSFKCYYKVAFERFVEMVSMQAVRDSLLTGPFAPAMVLSSTWVDSLPKVKL